MADEGVRETRVHTLLILGATGDLSRRLLLPGLARLIARGRAPGLVVVGSGSRSWSQEQWQDRVREAFSSENNDADPDAQRELSAAVQRSRYLQMDLSRPDDLGASLQTLDAPLAVYFGLPPALTLTAVQGLNRDDLPPNTLLVLEKPFGTDQSSARELNRLLADLVPEKDIFRVDHFLGMTTVMNLVGMRFSNRLLEPVWNSLHIEKMEILFDEQLALEGRAKYYDSSGALEDMIQSHLLHTMAFMAIGPPASLGERDLRDLVAAVLRASSVPEDFLASTRRARYTAGVIEGKEITGYTESPGVDPHRGTETLAEIEIAINNERWAGVPFILRSGKAQARRRKEAVVTFRPVNHLPEGFTGDTALPSRLRISFNPAFLELEMNVNGPADIFKLERSSLTAELHASRLTAYGEVLEAVLEGNELLSVRGDIAEECWRIVDPVLAAWRGNKVPMQTYAAGTEGPRDWNTSRSGL
ncbi:MULTISPECIES: glucose-6-phosphate dehydrogenase [Arthrobacter]|uniref:glucose-6-phosphate dehydrogenase n=1 Tax=Arthrobacter TaxID=1663 RepID=UPI001D146015|nr:MULTISPECIES: glucose-6-phosphate dehydrogenase [Arthrobacter]MCC3282500.1 glucose-6-phosphate dehydrogenase [Arthrobacter caoxuetaonis]MCC9193819.1 glucose-6-phosphate dehydrogenase [Arthrobacter sp. zg-Y916]